MNISDDNKNNLPTEPSKPSDDKFFRSTKDKVKFGLEIVFMLVVGFICIYPLALFFGNFLR